MTLYLSIDYKNNKDNLEKNAKDCSTRNRSILDLSYTEAKKFLLKQESYCNFDLPSYISFTKMLHNIDSFLSGKELSDVVQKPRNYDNLNYIIFDNKDGKYDWRPLELIHPVFYVSLVSEITKEENWNYIKSKFLEFSECKKIQCFSLPIESLINKKDKAEQIFNWWEKIEQKSIELSLDYEYMFQTDITDCYGSIYTHSIPWALHGKQNAKSNKNKNEFIGNIIDKYIQDISYGQTNGIPQGSVLMDFIAEMVLGNADLNLSKKIDEYKIGEYHIIRYRDDYHIFVNNPQDGDKIIKSLAEIMMDLGLKLSPTKTKKTNSIIKESLKSDKLYWISQKQFDKSLQKHLMLIHNLAELFPNSGSLKKALSNYNKRIQKLKVIKVNIMPLISIIVDIAYHSPKCYAVSSAILSKFISFIKDDNEKVSVIKRIQKKLYKLPNIRHLEIWLQRITIKFYDKFEYQENFCKIVAGAEESCNLWNVDCIKPKDLKKFMNASELIDREKIKNMPSVISENEVDLFKSTY